MYISILKSTKLRHKFCSRMEKTFGCKKPYGCGISCPFWIAFYVECEMNNKNLPLGEAFRLTIRESPTKEERKKIWRDVAENWGKPYPPKTANNKGYSGE